MTLTTRDEWEALSANEQFTLMHSLDTLTEAYQRVMHEIPECPAHGDLCTYHAIQWVRAVRESVKMIAEVQAMLVAEVEAQRESAEHHKKPADTSFGTIP
jgi:hypothetical protein